MIHDPRLHPSRVPGVRAVDLRHVTDRVRGDLAVVEFAEILPFQPRRCFWTYAIPDLQTRGRHAHRLCSQFLVCAHGRCRLHLDDGRQHEEWVLDRPDFGVLVPPMVWAEEHGHSPDSVLLVLASHPYDPDDYIRDYAEFLRHLDPAPTLPT
ncbi:MAG: WxcM-like domain-containing protein [Verrucomicrobiaceae bacterium]|jgi:UDP-2-acetamido-3-amino-2,3-dideoxy-glucuronate N-acetyltransferase|nr:WxcM-like domain-containing protein [Verrucomicrobiaceae bacterium]